MEETIANDGIVLKVWEKPGLPILEEPAYQSSDQHPALVYLARLSPGSRRAMRTALDTAARMMSGGAADHWTMPWHSLRYQHTAALLSSLTERYAPATVNKTLAALRGVLKECWRLGWMTVEEYQRAADLKAVKSSRLPAGRALTSGEIHALFLVCAKDPKISGIRDAALLAVLYSGGLRRSEVVALDFGDYIKEGNALKIRSGKGDKDRMVYLNAGTGRLLGDWLLLRGEEPGPLFCPVSRAGAIELRRITDQAVLDRLQRRAKAAGVTRFSPHDLRRTFISDLLDSGEDIVTVQKLAGHSNVQTTARYDRRGEEVKKRAASKLFVPYLREG